MSGATLSWVVDHDCQLVNVIATVSSIVSDQPDLTYAAWSTPAADLLDSRFYAQTNSGPVRFQLLKGQKIFVAPNTGGGSGSVQLILEDNSAEVA